MTARLADPGPPRTPIADLLDRWVGDAVEADAGNLTRAIYERALLGPLREFLLRPGKLFRARLVELGFQLAGGAAATCPPELPLLVEALHAGSLIVDDIEDGSDERRGAAALHTLHGIPVALNAGNWLYFWSQALLARLPLPDEARLRSHERIAHGLLRCHDGQALDLAVRVWDLPPADVAAMVRTITERKTGGLLELGCALGAIAAGADPRRAEVIGRFGREVGVALQMLDDLSGVVVDARRRKGMEDFEQGRATWIWAWLSRDLDARTYRSLVQELRRRGARSAESCLESARAHLGDAGVHRVRAQRDAAMQALRAAGGDDTRCREVADELARLERSYVQG